MTSTNDTIAMIAPFFKILANESRLSLLSTLRTPKTVDELLLSPSEARGEDRSEGPISRQAVQRHLDVLLDAGLVKRESSRRGVGRSGYAYVLDHTRVFAIVEEIRALTAYQSTMSADLVQTQSGPTSPRDMWEAGPKLVLVHGVREGQAFPLRGSDLRDGRGWIIGRSASAHAALAYDPFVSSEHTEIIRSTNGYTILALPSARNGTSLNWQQLPRGGHMPLQTGDIIMVGRSLLLFREN